MMKVSKAINIINENNFIFRGRRLRRATWKEKILFLLRPDEKRKNAVNLITYIADNICRSGSHDAKQYAALKKVWNACVRKYRKEAKLSKILEREELKICAARNDIPFQTGKNKDLENKIIRDGYNGDILRKFPEFAIFLEKSSLLSQMKITRDSIEIESGQPTILVEGKRVSWPVIREAFTWKRGRNGEQFIIDKKTRAVYTYLDNRKGLQKYHPYLDQRLITVSSLTEDDFNKTMDMAQKFKREGESETERERKNTERDFILQIVTSKTGAADTNFNNFIKRPRHAYIRLIIGKDNPELGTKKGEVYEAGFGHFGLFNKFSPLSTTYGKFRSPDIWEYMPCQQRLVTNVAISQQEAHNLYNFIVSYHNDNLFFEKKIAFHILKQNCTLFVEKACAAAGVTIATKISIIGLISEICPEKIKKIGRKLKRAREKMFNLEKRIIGIFPDKVGKMCSKIRSAAVALAQKTAKTLLLIFLLPINFLFGGANGPQAEELIVNRDEQDKDMVPPLRERKNWFKLSAYDIHMPAVLQRWQRQQPSTVIYENPLKMAVVPNN